MQPPPSAIDALFAGRHADPFALLGPHDGPEGTFVRAILPGCGHGRGLLAERRKAGQARPRRSPRAVRRQAARQAQTCQIPLSGRRGGMVGDRSLQLWPGARPARRFPDRRGHAFAAVRQVRRAPDFARGLRRGAFRGLGSECAGRQRGRRFQRLGRRAASDAGPAGDRRVGDFPPRSGPRPRLQVPRDRPGRGRAAVEGRSLRLRQRAAAQDRLDHRAPGQAQTGATRRTARTGRASIPGGRRFRSTRSTPDHGSGTSTTGS